MVKSVVKPQNNTLLGRDIVLKKSVFTRLFGVFFFFGESRRCPAPKCGAIPASLHSDKVNIQNLLYHELIAGSALRLHPRPLMCRESSPRYTRLASLATRDIASPKTTLSCFRLALQLRYISIWMYQIKPYNYNKPWRFCQVVRRKKQFCKNNLKYYIKSLDNKVNKYYNLVY